MKPRIEGDYESDDNPEEHEPPPRWKLPVLFDIPNSAIHARREQPAKTTRNAQNGKQLPTFSGATGDSPSGLVNTLAQNGEERPW